MEHLNVGVLTERQLQVLKSTAPGSVVRDIRTLRKLSKMGMLTLHEQTGLLVRGFWGGYVRAWYIETAMTFSVEGAGIFREKYFDGCFCPFLIRAEMDGKGRIKY